MKLASVSPAQQPELTLESLVSNKEMLQTHLSSILGSNNAEAPRALDVVQMGLSQQAGRRLVGGGPRGFDFRSLGNAGLDIVSSRHTMSPPLASLADHMTMAQRSFDNNISQVRLRPGFPACIFYPRLSPELTYSERPVIEIVTL